MYSEQPLGEVAVLNPDKLNGTWLMAGGGLAGTRVLDSQKGIMVYWMVAKSGEAPVCEPPEADVKACSAEPALCVWRHYEELFFSELLKDKKPGKPFFRTEAVIVTDQKSIAMMYEFVGQKKLDERLRRLVEKGAVPGRVADDGTVVLGALKPEHYKRIFEQESGAINWAQPIPLLKLPSALDPCKKGKQPH